MTELENIDNQLAQLKSFLGSELGYGNDSPGNLRRSVQENHQMILEVQGTLRGRGDEMGLVGWVSVIRRSWITLIALLGTAFGYALNDVIDTLEHHPHNPPSATTVVSEH